MKVGSWVGLGGIAGGMALLAEFRHIGSTADVAVGAVAIIMLFAGTMILFFSSRR